MPDALPSGISGLSSKTGWPIVAHNRYWYVICVVCNVCMYVIVLNTILYVF